MAIEVDLGEGKTATIREPDELRSGDQDAVLAHQRLEVDPETKQITVAGDMSNKMRKALLRRIITDWNLQHPLPSKHPDSLDKLTLGQQKALFAAVDPHMALLVETPPDPTAEGTDPTDA